MNWQAKTKAKDITKDWNVSATDRKFCFPKWRIYFRMLNSTFASKYINFWSKNCKLSFLIGKLEKPSKKYDNNNILKTSRLYYKYQSNNLYLRVLLNCIIMIMAQLYTHTLSKENTELHSVTNIICYIV